MKKKKKKYSGRTITFTFGQIPLGKVWTSYPPIYGLNSTTTVLLSKVEPDFGIMVRVFATGPGDQGSIPGRVIPKTQKMVLDASLFDTQHYMYGSRVKWVNSGEEVAPSPTPWCSSYRKGSLQITLDYGRQLYYLLTYCPSKRMHLALNNLTRLIYR